MSQSINIRNLQETGTTLKPNSFQKVIILCLEVCLAISIGWLISKLNIGGIAWIFGGIISGIIILQSSRIFFDYSPKPNRSIRKIGLPLVGLSIGCSIAGDNLINVFSRLPVFLGLTILLLLSGTLIGYLYSRLTQVNLLTSLFATVPGGVGVMSAIAADYNRDVTIVSLAQIIRVTSVVLIIPLIARVSTGNLITSVKSTSIDYFIPLQLEQLGLLLLALLLTAIAVYGGLKLKIPTAHFFAAILVGIFFNPALALLTIHIHFIPPPIFNLLGQILLGITIGEYWGEKPNLQPKLIGYSFLSMTMNLTAGFIAAFVAMQFTGWDWITCMLVTAPGGAAEIILVSMALHHNVELVTAGHLIRLIAINSSLPLWVYLFQRFDK